METSRLNLTGLAVALIAGLVAQYNTPPLMASLAGVTLLIALLGSNEGGSRTGLQSMAFGLVCGLAALCACSYPLKLIVPALGFSPSFVEYLPALVWALAAGIFWSIDRSGAESAQPQSVSLSSYSKPVAETRPVFTPAPVVAPPRPAPVPHFEPPPAPIEPEPVYAASPAPSAPQPMAVPPRTGKEVDIYVTMLGEGMSVLRSVRAEHLGRDFYVIVEEMPGDEKWEYTTGQVVRCKKKNLSNGKGMVAFEEAPRAQQQ